MTQVRLIKVKPIKAGRPLSNLFAQLMADAIGKDVQYTKKLLNLK